MMANKFFVMGCIATGCLLFTSCYFSTGLRPGYNRKTGRVTHRGEPVKKGFSQTGVISFYGPGFHGKKTANGETFDQDGMTAAHPTLPFNTRIRVTILSSSKSVVVRINDRGPFKKGRILDLSLGAAKKVGLVKTGTARATLKLL